MRGKTVVGFLRRRSTARDAIHPTDFRRDLRNPFDPAILRSWEVCAHAARFARSSLPKPHPDFTLTGKNI
jgi:hypothetical protein